MTDSSSDLSDDDDDYNLWREKRIEEIKKQSLTHKIEKRKVDCWKPSIDDFKNAEKKNIQF